MTRIDVRFYLKLKTYVFPHPYNYSKRAIILSKKVGAKGKKYEKVKELDALGEIMGIQKLDDQEQ